jgi:hypothetical protein
MAINYRADQTVLRYVRADFPTDLNVPQGLRTFLQEELDTLQQALAELTDGAVQVAEAEPSPKRRGMVRYAVSPWNPLGTGDGFVYWNGSAWTAFGGAHTHAASAITNTPAGNIAATDVQAALNELDTEKVPTTRTINTGTGITGGGDLSADRTLTMTISGLTAETVVDYANDYVPFHDASVPGVRKVKLDDLLSGERTTNAATYLKLDGTNAMTASVIFNQNNITPTSVEIARLDPFIYATGAGAESGGIEVYTKTGGSNAVIAEFSDYTYLFGQYGASVIWTDSGSGEGPYFSINRYSASPAANDYLGLVRFGGDDSNSNYTVYASIGAQIEDPTDGSEDGRLLFYTRQAGSVSLAAEITSTKRLVLNGNTVQEQVQQVTTSSSALATGTTVLPFDDTIPQNTEGVELTAINTTITPKATTNKLVIDVTVTVSHSAAGTITAALFQDSTANALTAVGEVETAAGLKCIHFRHVMDAGTTSATTFKLRCGNSAAGTLTYNGVSGARRYGGIAVSRMTITEFVP